MTRIFALANAVVRTLLTIAMLALLAMMLMIVSDVFMRYIFNAPILGTYDVVEICLVIAVTFSFGAVISGSQEIVIDLIDQFVPARFVTVLKRIAAFGSATVLVFIFTSMITPTLQSHRYGEIRLELNMPVWIVWAIALVGMAGGVLASLVQLLKPLDQKDHSVADRSET